MTAIDPVCGMDVDEKTAEEKGLVTEPKGQKYWFCAHGCLRRFEKDPERFISK